MYTVFLAHLRGQFGRIEIDRGSIGVIEDRSIKHRRGG